jgi:hypothetical protein
MTCASVNLPFAVLDAELIVVELIVSELSAGLTAACANIPKVLESGPASIVDDVRGVLRFILWGAGEHGQNTSDERNATGAAAISANSVVRM